MFLTKAYLEFELMEEKVQHGKHTVLSHAGLKNPAILAWRQGWLTADLVTCVFERAFTNLKSNLGTKDIG